MPRKTTCVRAVVVWPCITCDATTLTTSKPQVSRYLCLRVSGLMRPASANDEAMFLCRYPPRLILLFRSCRVYSFSHTVENKGGRLPETLCNGVSVDPGWFVFGPRVEISNTCEEKRRGWHQRSHGFTLSVTRRINYELHFDGSRLSIILRPSTLPDHSGGRVNFHFAVDPPSSRRSVTDRRFARNAQSRIGLGRYWEWGRRRRRPACASCGRSPQYDSHQLPPRLDHGCATPTRSSSAGNRGCARIASTHAAVPR